MSLSFSEKKSEAHERGNEKTLGVPGPFSCVCILDFVTLGRCLKGAAVNTEVEKNL